MGITCVSREGAVTPISSTKAIEAASGARIERIPEAVHQLCSIFSSNKHDCDGRKFELFMINLDGTGLEQVTNFGGFTAFPEISPDGKKLVFASDKDAKQRYEFNIFTADWK